MSTSARRGCPRGPTILLLLVLIACGAVHARACDVCAVYTAAQTREGRPGWSLSVAEQYTHFGTERLNGDEVSLPADERLDSSITQFVVGYAFTPRLGLQLNIPYIDRTFTRIHDHALQHGRENGIGDVALVGDVLAFQRVAGDSMFRFSLLGGIKFPTGNSGRLAEELAPVPAAAAVARVRPRHSDHGPPVTGEAGALPAEGGLHGHDLALGSGSFDGLVGGHLFWSWGRFFTTAAMQYAIRSQGDFAYRYANDLTWLGGPGWYVLLTHDYSLGAQAVLSGETKGKDTQQGHRADDTAITALYVGPGVSFTWRGTLGAELAADLPVYQHNSSLQLVPDARVRGGLTWRF